MKRALVLSGGGPVGVAWESGLVAGFAQGGVDLGAADFILGTSAGAIVGARLAAGVPAERLAAACLARAPGDAPGASFSSDRQHFDRVMALMAESQKGTRHPAEARRELGEISLASQTMSEERFMQMIAVALADAPRQGWPARPFACTAVDVEDGGFQMWDASFGVDLLPAVTSSCSVPGLFPPISLNGRRYMDGGMRSASNADLVAGHDIVVVISVQPPGAPSWMADRLDEEVETLQVGDATVVTITPDDDSGAAFGGDMMDVARDAAVARAGLAQGLNQAAILKQVWG